MSRSAFVTLSCCLVLVACGSAEDTTGNDAGNDTGNDTTDAGSIEATSIESGIDAATDDAKADAVAEAGPEPDAGDAGVLDGGQADGTLVDSNMPDAASDQSTPPGPSECTGECYYLLAGGTGDGSSWASALGALPAKPKRGVVYYVGKGVYGDVTLDDAEAGNERVTVRRATTADHGDDAGWSAAYADGEARFGRVAIDVSNVTIDGGPDRTLRVVSGFQGATVVIRGDDVTLRNLDIDGAFQANASGTHVGGACAGLELRDVQRVRVEGCDIHDAADDGVLLANSIDVKLLGNRVRRLHGCGTDGACPGPCFNGHSDGFEIVKTKSSEISGNLVFDVRPTSALYFRQGEPANRCEDIVMHNNVFYTPTGLVAYVQNVSGLDFFHNVVWGKRAGAYGGLAIGKNVFDLDMVNNILLSVNYSHLSATHLPAEHREHHNLFGVDLNQFPADPSDLVAPDPGFVGVGDMNSAVLKTVDWNDFALEASSPAIDEGATAASGLDLPDTDALGSPRDSEPDIGALEF